MFKLLILTTILLLRTALSDFTYYEILGVTKQASSQEVRQAYKKLAIKFHPDKNPEASVREKFLKITEAYETLKDPDKRKNYDIHGNTSPNANPYGYRNEAEYNNLLYNGLYHDDPFVDTLTASGYYNYVQESQEMYFINFYSPFCPPCQKLADHWKKLAELYKGVVKVAAVNCKQYFSFCYNNMRIGSFPSLLLYPNGRKGGYIYYRNEQKLDPLDQFVMSYLSNKVHIPVITQLRNTDQPTAYVLGSNKIEKEALTRVAYQLKGIVTVVVVEDDHLRNKLSKDEYATIVFKFKKESIEIDSTNEKNILKEIVAALPTVEPIDPDKFKKIRNQLRSDHGNPWVFYFLSNNDDQDDRLLLHQMIVEHPELNFGSIDCESWGSLCASLQARGGGGWGVLKRRGAYQRVRRGAGVAPAAAAHCLHSLQPAELRRALRGEAGTWFLAVIPHNQQWEHIIEPFTKASMHFTDSEDINFGITVCTEESDEYCREVAAESPALLLQQGRRREHFPGQITESDIVQFVHLLLDSTDMDLEESQVMEIMDAHSREHTWLVAFLPAHCGRPCDQLLHEWRLVAKRLRPLDFMRVGALRCARAAGLCASVRSPSARLYPLAAGHHYSAPPERLAGAARAVEWALALLDDCAALAWAAFNRHVLTEELNPKSGKKPWLIYFHSPRCFHCYEMYADFAITGINLSNAVQLGKVNCLAERGLCQHEQITSYPALKLYLGRNKHHQFSSVISLPVRDHTAMLKDIMLHLKKYDPSLLENNIGLRSQGIHMKHDEL